ncbi:MAG: DUF11 domain-containing protein [Blastocatellia bacterium]
MFALRTLAISTIVAAVAFGFTAVPVSAQATGADLRIVKTAPLIPYGTNSVIEYTLQISNDGPATATIVQVVDPTPVGTTFVSVSVPAGWIFTAPTVGGTGNVVCSTSSLAPDATATIVLQVRIASTTLAGVRIINTATIDAQQPDPIPSTNTSSWEIEVSGADSDTPGIVDSTTGAWFLRNMNSGGSADVVFTYGAGGVTQRPFEGDYNNDGRDTPGIYDQTSGAIFLRNTNSAGGADIVFTFGPAATNWIPITGDWDNDGFDTIGLYIPATGTFFLKNSNTPGPADITFTFGIGGAAIPVAGDWNGDGVDSIGIYDPASGAFFLRNSNSNGGADFVFTFGAPFSTPLSGDWDGDGIDTIGIYAPASGAWFLRNVNSGGAASAAFTYGAPNMTPIAGDWNGL